MERFSGHIEITEDSISGIAYNAEISRFCGIVVNYGNDRRRLAEEGTGICERMDGTKSERTS